MRLTFLGTGTSFGVPQIGCRCAVCTSGDPRDRRTRCGAVIETNDGTRLLIDTPPELRLQLVAAGIGHVDAVLFTHEHADHIHGIDDLRALTVRRSGPLPLYGEAPTLDTLRSRFPYVFDAAFRPLPGTTRPEGLPIEVRAGETFAVGNVEVLPLAVPHGRASVLGFRVGDMAYITDAKEIPPASMAALRGVRVLVLNALLRRPHPTHLSIAEAIATAQQVGAERTYFTHLTHDNAHAALEAELPAGIMPAYDGLVVDLDHSPSHAVSSREPAS
ncbi:MBL fold metallo-hydrolase [Gemmatimonas sp. UBA7669]|uniref:MBL fold metallo-hydrolase n=1 Tax=Gemmatimonas sp. UBA7669 TaxID=1946568 RepID=UPI0025BD2DF1|nr:MBL fold metallo-hydrolase [Gemmatimonas sp. UBA7669]